MQFRKLSHVAQRYKDAETAYTEGHELLEKARQAKEKFETSSSKRQAAMGIKLPKSLQLNLVDRARLSDSHPADEPNFFRDLTDDLKEIEKEASERIYKIMLSAKERLVDYRYKQISAQAFIHRSTESYAEFVRAEIARLDQVLGCSVNSASAPSSVASSNSSFRIEDAVTHFQQHLQQFVNATAMTISAKLRQAEEQKQQAIAANHDGAEKVVGEAHNGGSISAIAARTVQKSMAPLQQQVQQLQQQVAAQSSAKHNSVAGNKHARNVIPVSSSDDEDAVPAYPRVTITKDHRSRSVKSHSHHGQSSKKSHRPPAASLTDRRKQQPTNLEGGGRHSKKRQKKEKQHQGKQQGSGGN